MLRDLIPDPETLLALEPEQLASYVLRALNEHGNSWTIEHVMGQLFAAEGASKTYDPQYEQDVRIALAEAWNWLEVQGLIVWPGQSDGAKGYRVPSRRGRSLRTAEAFKEFATGTQLPKEFLHPALREYVWLMFLSGRYDTAVFEAFKQVEVAVRNVAGFTNSEYGVDLMRKAFDPERGPLTDAAREPSERQALSHLFAGAIGYYKNPQSHREVGITDPSDAREMIMLASHLLRIIDQRRAKLAAQ